jgi:putative transposase
MDTIGDADNAIIEALCGRMQTELLDRRRWTTRVELANAPLRDWRSSTGNDAAAR